MIKVMQKIEDIVYAISERLVGILLVTITALVTISVISRFLFAFSIDFAQELVIFCMVWMTFLGTSMGLKEGSLITLTLLIDKLPAKLQGILRLISRLILLSFFIITTISNQSVLEFARVIKLPTLGIPYSTMGVAYSVSAGIMIFYLLVSIIKSLHQITNKSN